MQQNSKPSLSKSEFLLYLDAPCHLWAKAQGQLPLEISDFDAHLAQEGMQVEALAQEYLRQFILPQHPGAFLSTQESYRDGPYQCRVDALICGLQGGGCALFEIKSSTGIDKQKVYDLAYQALIMRQACDLRQVYLLHLNKNYRRGDALDLQDLFVCEELSDRITELEDQVLQVRQEAWKVLETGEMLALEACFDPRSCPCPQFCHPELPEYSIYDIPRLTKDKKAKLRDAGLVDIQALPSKFPLNPKQARIAQVLRSGEVYCDAVQIGAALQDLHWPLYFLDYETCPAALPRYPGYAPQQQIVFQYSLHKLSAPDGEPEHFEALVLGPEEPSAPLMENLRRNLGTKGSVIVWNQTFEMGRNRELAALHPQHADFLDGVNERVFDLMKIIEDGAYLHPGFRGRASIKNVLPVMVPELSYENLEIQIGGQATAAWQRSFDPLLGEDERDRIRRDLLAYCHLDSLAMLEIYRRLRYLAGLET